MNLKELVAFVSKKTGVKSLELIERDILLHMILRRLYSDEHFKENYLFKGGTCLVKCYLGYYRFSIDLDFTYYYRGEWLSRAKRRELITKEVKYVANLLKRIAGEQGLIFEPYLGKKFDNEFLHFEGNENRKIVFFELRTEKGEIIKVEVIFFEKLFFEPKIVTARTLLSETSLSPEERAFYEEELLEYSPVEVFAYDPREILTEKVRAILTRKFQKARDFYDVFMLSKVGYDYRDFEQEILEKVEFTGKYNPNVEKIIRDNVGELEGLKDKIAFKEELVLFAKEPEKEFWRFIDGLGVFLMRLIPKILNTEISVKKT
jgi:predicted nucleotidyltransferase component of viral defense system